MIITKKLIHDYLKKDDEGNIIGRTRALDAVDLDVKAGEFVAILGHNGSGKSTLAKHINALLFPTGGTVEVDGMDTTDESHLWDVRQEAGMVFQDPDNQIIGQVVEEDVGFGPENLGVPTKEIWERVEESLRVVGMYEYRKKSPNHLSGGQKQRVSIAGVIAMHPKCIIFDEPTAMLDPSGRKEVIRAARALNEVEGITILLITHYMEEAIYADKVYVMDQGRVAMQGTPREVFSRVEELKAMKLDVPEATMVSWLLQRGGIPLPDGVLTKDELAEHLEDACPAAFDAEQAKPAEAGALPPENTEQCCSAPVCEKADNQDAVSAAPGERACVPVDASCSGRQADRMASGDPDRIIGDEEKDSTSEADALGGIEIRNVSYIYNEGSAMESRALDGLSTRIPHGQFIGLIGHTGSGKSTFVQMLNGLLKPSAGSVWYDGQDIWADGYPRRQLRAEVGLVFQYPEHQLFEADVLTDVKFGPKNLGLPEEEQTARAIEALRQVEIGEQYYKASPFELSGGQKRRVAIAGVLAMRPKIMILDEPTAGLDPMGRDEILGMISRMHRERGMTIVLVSHSMDDVARYVQRIMVMNAGNLLMDGAPHDIFAHVRELEDIGLAAPQVTYILDKIRARGLPVRTDCLTVEETAEEILRAVGKAKSRV